MTQSEEMKSLIAYLESYKLYRAMRELAREDGDAPPEAREARQKIREIRSFVTSMPDSREKLFLFYHYIGGRSMERCAEMFGVAERSIYRIRRRALDFALGYFSPERSDEREAG
jgi:DNA-directed RNA polymerase specialized sigma24 family protein